jgi:hypothetical protein
MHLRRSFHLHLVRQEFSKIAVEYSMSGVRLDEPRANVTMMTAEKG